MEDTLKLISGTLGNIEKEHSNLSILGENIYHGSFKTTEDGLHVFPGSVDTLHRAPCFLKGAMWGPGNSCIAPLKLELPQPETRDSPETQEGGSTSHISEAVLQTHHYLAFLFQ